MEKSEHGDSAAHPRKVRVVDGKTYPINWEFSDVGHKHKCDDEGSDDTMRWYGTVDFIVNPPVEFFGFKIEEKDGKFHAYVSFGFPYWRSLGKYADEYGGVSDTPEHAKAECVKLFRKNHTKFKEE